MGKERLVLVLPGGEHKKQVTEYKNEFLAHGDSMDGGANLDRISTFEAWLDNAGKRRNEETVEKGLVPATVYLAVEQETGDLIGMVDIRHRLTGYLLQHGGHIGYSVRKSRRREGFGTEILGLALLKCRELGIGRVLVTCAKTNTGSAKIIQKNGGVLENEIQEETRVTQRYWISL